MGVVGGNLPCSSRVIEKHKGHKQYDNPLQIKCNENSIILITSMKWEPKSAAWILQVSDGPASEDFSSSVLGVGDF